MGLSAPIQRAAQIGTETVGSSDPSGNRGEFVNYDPGPDSQSLQREYDVDLVKGGQAAKLQRLEDEHGSESIQRWASEGMTVETMGKPKDMQAFRHRQAGRPPEVPTDVERRNQASVHRNADADDAGPAGEVGAPDAVRNVVSSPGTSMDEPVQREMESKMGGDFSDVQIHTGPKAAHAAESINARAFTVGNHVAFNEGEYDPGSKAGKKTIAHELTHVRQQTDGRISMLPKATGEHPGEAGAGAAGGTITHQGTEMYVQPKLEVSSPDDPAEKEAERVAEQVVQMDDSAEAGRSVDRSPSARRVHRESESGGGSGGSGGQETSVNGFSAPLTPEDPGYFYSGSGSRSYMEQRLDEIAANKRAQNYNQMAQGAEILKSFGSQEGYMSAINTWDGEVLTWGPGFAHGGYLDTLWEKLNSDVKSFLASQSGYFSSGGISVDEGIRTDEKALNALVYVAEHDPYQRLVLDKMYETFMEENLGVTDPEQGESLPGGSFNGARKFASRLAHWLPVGMPNPEAAADDVWNEFGSENGESEGEGVTAGEVKACAELMRRFTKGFLEWDAGKPRPGGGRYHDDHGYNVMPKFRAVGEFLGEFSVPSGATEIVPAFQNSSEPYFEKHDSKEEITEGHWVLYDRDNDKWVDMGDVASGGGGGGSSDEQADGQSGSGGSSSNEGGSQSGDESQGGGGSGVIELPETVITAEVPGGATATGSGNCTYVVQQGDIGLSQIATDLGVGDGGMAGARKIVEWNSELESLETVFHPGQELTIREHGPSAQNAEGMSHDHGGTGEAEGESDSGGASGGSGASGGASGGRGGTSGSGGGTSEVTPRQQIGEYFDMYNDGTATLDVVAGQLLPFAASDGSTVEELMRQKVDWSYLDNVSHGLAVAAREGGGASLGDFDDALLQTMETNIATSAAYMWGNEEYVQSVQAIRQVRGTSGEETDAEGETERGGSASGEGDSGESGGGGDAEQPDWIRIAEGEQSAGIQEWGPDNYDAEQRGRGLTQEEMENSNPEIKKYFDQAGYLPEGIEARGDHVPWCAVFVNYCIEQAGYDGASPSNGGGYCGAAANWEQWGQQVSSPKYGCVAVVKGGSHVGFVVGKSGSNIQLLGGNQSDEVNVSTYSTAGVTYYGLPGGVDPSTLPSLGQREAQAGGNTR